MNLSKLNTELAELLRNRNGASSSSVSSALTKLSLTCATGHSFSESLLGLRKGKWCEKCKELEKRSELETLLLEFGIEHSRKQTAGGLELQIQVEESTVLLYLDPVELGTDPLLESHRSSIRQQLEELKGTSGSMLRVSEIDLLNRPRFEEWLGTQLSELPKFGALGPDRYHWLFPEPSSSSVSNCSATSSSTAIVSSSTSFKPPPKDVQFPPEEDSSSDEESELESSSLVARIPDPEPKSFISPDGSGRQVVRVKPQSTRSAIFPAPPNTGIVLGYCRVSTVEQTMYGTSLDNQKDKIQEYARYKGLHVKRFYADEGISGRNIATREALLLLLEEMQPKDTLVVISLSRLARNSKQATEIEERIRAKGGYLVALDYDINTNTAVGKLIFQILNSFNEFESNQTSERVSSSMSYLSARGKLKGKPPYGMKFVGKNQPFERDEDEFRIIEQIRRMKQDTPYITPTKIAKVLNEQKAPCRKAKEWYCSTVQKIMKQNEIS